MNYTKEQLEQMLQAMPGNNIVYRVNDGKIACVTFSDQIGKLTGIELISHQEVDDPFPMILSEDREMIREKINQEIYNENSQGLEAVFRLVHKLNGFVWIHMNLKRVGMMDEDVVFIASLVDVSKEMNGSDTMAAASERSICVIEKATKRFLYANAQFYDLIDSSPAEAMGKYCYELLCKTMEMKDNDNCLCFSSLNVEDPIETYNPAKKKYLTMSGREITWGEYDAYVFYLTDITKIKEKEEALIDANKRFNVALDNSELMIWEYDMVNNLCINSEKAGRDYNIPLVIENYPESLFETGHTPPETIEQIKDVKRRLFNGETGFSVERRTVDKNGKSQWQKVEYSLERDAGGKPVRAIVCGMDITAQKELEERYKEQIEYRNNLAKKSLFSIRYDLEDKKVQEYISNNAKLEERLKQAEQEEDFLQALFKNAEFDARSEISKEELTVYSLLSNYELGRSQYQNTYRCTLIGKYLELNLNIYKNPATNHLEAFIVLTDVTNTAMMAAAFQSVVSKDYDLVAVINVEDGSATFITEVGDRIARRSVGFDDAIIAFAEANKAAYYSEEDYIAVTDGIMLENVIEKLQHMPVYEFNCRTRGKDGETDTYRLSFSYGDEQKTQIIFSRANVTKMMREERKQQAELSAALKAAKAADRAKTEFLSRMSHDMRTPMNGILGMTRLTQDIPGLSKEAQDNLAAITESSSYLLQLINDTLDMSKIESKKFTLHPEVVNVGTLIQHIIATIKPVAEQKNITLEFVPINAQLEYIRTDRIRVQQLFMNVLSNSVKFTPPGGKIRMEVECLRRENGIAYDRISVEDNGCGMSKEFLAHIYEPFSQEHTHIVEGHEGTGLGMSIVKNLVELMGGTLEIESELGKGTKVTAYINFERVYDVEEQSEIQKNSVQSDLNGMRILLAEDHPLNATIATRLLAKKGVVVERAKDGIEAVNMYEKSECDYYDMILMDIRMPELNGLEATKRIRELDRTDAKMIPIIAMTANAYDEDVRASLAVGMNAHLAKPIEPEVMYETIGKYMK